MRESINRLLSSADFLYHLNEIFEQEYPLYSEVVEKLEGTMLYDKFCREIYVGGKKGGRVHGYNRQMILGDLLQYVLTGRGYYFAVKGNKYMESFIKILMYVSNLIILMEDTSTDVNLRNKVLKYLEEEMGEEMFENREEKEKFYGLMKYDGFIVGEEGGEYEEVFDSIFPKRVGFIPEILVYAYLIRKKYGYVVPLLQAQRLLGNQKYIIPPDFLLLRSKGESFGLEVGRGKEQQIGSFSTVTSIPVFTVGIGALRQPQPYRCGKCRKWIAYCDKVIDICAKNEDDKKEFLDCKQVCPLNHQNCPHRVYHGEAHDYSGNNKTLRYHYLCVKDDDIVKKELEKKTKRPRIIAPIPFVSGLEHIKEEE